MFRAASDKKGFSLVELMIVVAIIGILAAVAAPAYFNHVLRVKQTNGVNNLLDIKVAQEKYYALFDEYASPGTLTTADTVFASYLSFDVSNTMYLYIILGDSTSFSANLKADIDSDGSRTDCWEITSISAQPSQVTSGGSCKSEGEKFGFSIIGDLFD